jgi:GR25 family glycosyltransferase involved in LPS biosynthesis
MLLKESYISFVNLDHRKDRLQHMANELNRVGIQAVRQRGIPWKEADHQNPKYQAMVRRTPGALGCHLSQVEIWNKAFEVGSHAFVMEDDLVFATDIKDRLAYISKWIAGKDWDVIWLGGTFHSPAFWHPVGPSKMRPNCSANLGKDFDNTDDPRIKRTYGAFSTHAYIVNYKSIRKIQALFDKHIHESIGIDWLFIKLQPQLKCYAFVPGSVKQINNLSDIGTNTDGTPAMTMYSGFAQLNGTFENSLYWFKDKIEEFNPDTFIWK